MPGGHLRFGRVAIFNAAERVHVHAWQPRWHGTAAAIKLQEQLNLSDVCHKQLLDLA